MSRVTYRLKPINWNKRVLGGEETYSAKVGGMYVFIAQRDGVFTVYYEYNSSDGVERSETYGSLAIAKARAENHIEQHLTKPFERIIE